MDGQDAPLVQEYADRSLMGAIAGSHAAAAEGREARTYDVGLWIAVGAALVVGLFLGFLGGVVAEQQRWGFAFTSASSESAPAVVPNPVDGAGALTGGVRAGSTAGLRPAVAGSGSATAAPRGGPPSAAVPETRVFSEAAVAPEPVAGDGLVGPARAAVDPQPVALTPRSAAESDTGALQVLSRPSGAQVVVDGRVAGKTPLSIPGVRAGAHDVRIELPGFRRWATSVTVTGGDRTRVAASLEQ